MCFVLKFTFFKEYSLLKSLKKKIFKCTVGYLCIILARFLKFEDGLFDLIANY